MAFLIGIGTTIVTKLAEYTVDPALRQVGYVIFYRNNLKELETQVDDLGYARDSMKHAVETEERSGKNMEEGVQSWFTKVEQLIKEADDLEAKHLAQTKCLFCPNLKLRHHLGRKSAKLVLEVAKHHDKKFVNIAYDDPLEEMCAIAIQDYQPFDSRSSAAKDVINELINSKTYMIRVYGIGGVGKTTLVTEVYNRLAARSEKLFDEVVMVLDLKPSIEEIQQAIAGKLRLELPASGTPDGRACACLISNRIKKKKTLVILDNVQESIDLDAVGLPHMATLKILFTSRSKLVLANDKRAQKEFHLKVLKKDEAWRLFQTMAGDIVEKPDIRAIATRVAEKCGGLPILIITVARSLKDGLLCDWNDTFRRLKKFDGKGRLTEKTYSAIEWSYDKLDHELKSVFLLCATEVWSSNSVWILDLLKYSMGLGFIKDVDTIEEARDALHSLLNKLQHYCLLLDTKDNQCVRIHDLVKDVAKQIAATDQHVLSVSRGSELKEWPDKEFREKCTTICLRQCNTPELPEVLECPKLTLFHLNSVADDSSRKIPNNFFKEMKKLKVLDLTNWSIPSLPPSLKFLKDLHTLCLDQCILGDLALVGELQNLKILSLFESRFEQLPQEIGKLSHLILLDLTSCYELKVISPDVISKLNKIEELRMGKNSFNNWEAGRVGDSKRCNASLEELTCLPRLTALQLHVPDANILPANLFSTSELKRFQICIGSMWKWDEVDEAHNALQLQLTTKNELDQGLKILLKRTQDLYVEDIEGVNDKFFHELATGGYQQLIHLHVQNNAKFAYTINEVGFPNLTWLAVSELNGQRFLLSSSVARNLSQLKRIQISGCQIMKEIISIEESNQEIAVNFFPKLQELELKGLPNLTKLCSASYDELPNTPCERLQLEDSTENGGICEQVEEIDSKGNLDIVIQYFLFDNKVEFPNMKKLSLDGLAKLTTIWNNQHSLDSSKNLETMEIVSCDNLRRVFPACVAKNLQQLRSLKVKNCGIEEIISQDEGVLTAPMFVFPKLTYLKFENLPQLKSFYPGLHSSKFPSLLTLSVYRCTKVQIFERGICELNNVYTSDKQSLFLLEKDNSFPNLETLGLDVMENWDSPPVHTLRNLKALHTYAHTNSSLDSLEKLLGLEKVNGEIHLVTNGTFPLLTVLYLCGMRKLINLGDDSFGPACLYFPKLEILVLEDCDSLKNLRSSAISFNNLTTLKVSRCKGLKYLISFSMAKSLMQLTTLEVRDCEEMIEIVATSGNDESTNVICFKMLKHLELSSLPSLKGFWSGSHIIKFPSVENLSMTSCSQLEGFIFDPTGKGSLCHDFEDIDSNDSNETGAMQRFLFDNKVEFPNLKKLFLNGLEKLTTIWNNQLSLDSSNNLEMIDIDSCCSLKSIFSASMAKNFRQLRSLEVQHCGVEEIVSKKNAHTTPTFVFSRLTYLRFENLPQFRTFYPGLHSTKWPSLLSLLVYRCPKVQIFAKGIHELKNPSTRNKRSMFLLEKDSFPNLERLGLGIMENWDSPPLHLFMKLKTLRVYAHANSSLNSMEKLLGLENVNGGERNAAGNETLPHLTKLGLFRMRKLMNLGNDSSGSSGLYIENLKILMVEDCDSLMNLRSSVISFNNLTTLQVSGCMGLKYLISFSMVNSLKQLTTLEVKECPSLVQIVGSNDEDDSRDEITFRRLKHLKLSVLPRLQSFCLGDCIAKLPSLETSTMSSRLKLKIFAADSQTLQLITNDGDDTEDEHWEARLTAAPKKNSSSICVIS